MQIFQCIPSYFHMNMFVFVLFYIIIICYSWILFYYSYNCFIKLLVFIIIFIIIIIPFYNVMLQQKINFKYKGSSHTGFLWMWSHIGEMIYSCTTPPQCFSFCLFVCLFVVFVSQVLLSFWVGYDSVYILHVQYDMTSA